MYTTHVRFTWATNRVKVGVYFLRTYFKVKFEAYNVLRIFLIKDFGTFSH